MLGARTSIYLFDRHISTLRDPAWPGPCLPLWASLPPICLLVASTQAFFQWPRLPPATEPWLRCFAFPLRRVLSPLLQPPLPFHLQISTPLSLRDAFLECPYPRSKSGSSDYHIISLHHPLLPFCLLMVSSTTLQALGRQELGCFSSPFNPYILIQYIEPYGCATPHWYMDRSMDGWVSEWMNETDFSNIHFINMSYLYRFPSSRHFL